MTVRSKKRLANVRRALNDPNTYWPAEICSEDYFKKVVAAAYTGFIALRRNSLPSVDIVVRYMRNSARAPLVASVMATSEFRKAMANRGVDWSDLRSGITPEQSFAISIVTDPTAGSFNVRLKKAGITYQKWNSWLREPLFNQAFTAITEGSLNDNLGAVHTALVSKATSGDVRAIEFYYQITGRFDPAREATMNMNAVLLSIIEILTKRISDSSLLAVISSDLERLISTTPSRALTSELEILDAEIINEPAPVGVEVKPGLAFELPTMSRFTTS